MIMAGNSKWISAVLLIAGALACFYMAIPKGEKLTPDSVFVDGDTVSAASEYVSPIDFEKAREENRDIYAWIKIPGLPVDYPVLRKPGDDDYYLRRNLQGKYSVAGCLYTQAKYNGDDFSDRVTIIYGHNMTNGSMFGMLEDTYSNPEDFEKYSDIRVYLPKQEKHYRVVAAVPYSDLHIMEQFGRFEIDEDVLNFEKFICDSKETGAVYNRQWAPNRKDKLLILATCQKGNYKRRYIIVAKLIDEANF